MAGFQKIIDGIFAKSRKRSELRKNIIAETLLKVYSAELYRKGVRYAIKSLFSV